MARPIKETVDFFPHFIASGKTIFILESTFGNDGYAFWFKLLEILCSRRTMVFDFNDRSEVRFLLAKTRVNESLCMQLLETLADVDAIDRELWQNHRLIWSQNLVEHLSKALKRRVAEKPQKPVIVAETEVIDTETQVIVTEIKPTIDEDEVYVDNNPTRKKERKKERKKDPPISPRGEVKIKYADYVFLTEDEHRKLTELLGEEERDRFFLEFASWISGQTKRVQNERSAYLTILNWFKREQKNPKPVRQQGSSYQRTKSKLQQMYEEAVANESGGNH